MRNAIRNASGPRPALFVPEACFEVLVKRQIAKLEAPAQKCADLVFEELQRMILRIEADRKEFRRFPNLATRIVEVAGELIKERLAPTRGMIEHLVRIETAYINTSHPDFCRSGASYGILSRLAEEHRTGRPLMMAQRNSLSSSSSFVEEQDLPLNTISVVPSNESNLNSPAGGFLSYLFKQPVMHLEDHHAAQKAKSPRKRKEVVQRQERPKPVNYQLAEKEELEVQLIMSLLHSYLDIVRKNLLDSVPKTIMYFLVNHVIEQLPTRMVSALYREEMFAELLSEDDSVVRQRQRCKIALEAYHQAAVILGDLRDAEINPNKHI